MGKNYTNKKNHQRNSKRNNRRKTKNNNLKKGGNPNVIEISGEENLKNFFEALLKMGMEQKKPNLEINMGPYNNEQTDFNDEYLYSDGLYSDGLYSDGLYENDNNDDIDIDLINHEIKQDLHNEKERIIKDLQLVKNMIIEEILSIASNTNKYMNIQNEVKKNEQVKKKKKSCQKRMKKKPKNLGDIYDISLDGGNSLSWSIPSWEERLQRERPYLSDPLNRRADMNNRVSPLIQKLNPPELIVGSNNDRHEIRERIHGRDCLCGIELQRVMRGKDKRWANKFSEIQERNYYLERENRILKKKYTQMLVSDIFRPGYSGIGYPGPELGSVPEFEPHSIPGSKQSLNAE